MNGKPANGIAINDRGLQYGDGLFETILYLDGHGVLQAEHLLRLYRDTKRMGIRLDESRLEKELASFQYQARQDGLARGVIKLLVTRESTGRGYAADPDAGSNRILQFYPGVSYPGQHRDGVRAALASHRLPYQPSLAGIKHLNRLDQVLLQKELRKPFYQEVLACAEHGEVIEGSFSNVFIIKNRELFTPKLDRAGVRGVMRDYLMNVILPDLGLDYTESALSVEDVITAEEIFLCNSVFGIWPVIAVNVRQFHVGPVTRALQAAVDRLGYSSVYR